MLRNNLELASGLVWFRDKDSARAYLEALLEYYKARQDEYGQQLAEELRSAQEAPQPAQRQEKESKKDKDGPRPMAKGWSRVGSLPVNSSDPRHALAEVTLRIIDDYKARVERIAEALKSLQDVDSLSQPGTKAYTLFIYRGVPEGVIVDDLAKKQEVFAFTASFRAV